MFGYFLCCVDVVVVVAVVVVVVVVVEKRPYRLKRKGLRSNSKC